MMTPGFWQALERLGAGESALGDWRHLLGSGWEKCCPFLKRVPGHASSMIDPARPSRRLDVVPEGEDGFDGIAADGPPDGPPLRLPVGDVVLMTPDWNAIANELGKLLAFAANPFDTDGLTRQIGTAQSGGDPVRPVVLWLPAGHFGDGGRIIADLASRRDATILLPSAKWVTPPVQSMASANRLTLVSVAAHLSNPVGTPAPALARPRQSAGTVKSPGPLFTIQPGWRWDRVALVVAPGGRLLFSCDGQRREHRLPKTSSKKPGQALGILMRLAVKQEWSNPPSDAPDHESVRKNFHRLEQRLRALLPLPDDPFRRESGRFIPVFDISLHPDLLAGAAGSSNEPVRRHGTKV